MENDILVDAYDNPIGTEEKISAHEKGLLHRAFSVFVLREYHGKKQLLLQQRQATKYHAGGLWTNTCCSHPRPDEDVIDAAVRRLQEEMGFSIPLKEIGTFTYRAEFENGLIEHEFDHILIGNTQQENFDVNPREVMAYRWSDFLSVDADYHADPTRFTPWFFQAFEIVRNKFF